LQVTDRKGALEALERSKPNLKRVKSLLCDSGYMREPFAQWVRAIPGEPVAARIAKRWIVERSFA
jgi:hypothetical protein